MNQKLLTWKVVLALGVFSPLALFSSPGRSAMLDSEPCYPPAWRSVVQERAKVIMGEKGLPRDRAELLLGALSGAEVKRLIGDSSLLNWGGENGSDSHSNEFIAIILTLLMLGAVIGFVGQQQHR